MRMTHLSYKCPDGEPDDDFEAILTNFMRSQGWKYDGTGMNMMTIPWTRDVFFVKIFWWTPLQKLWINIQIIIFRLFHPNFANETKYSPPIIDEDNDDEFHREKNK
jgi:hypothetical protein